MSIYKTQSELVTNIKPAVARAENVFTKVYQDLQKGGLTEGSRRTYTPKLENGDPLPAEAKPVLVQADTALAQAARALRTVFDLNALRDATNVNARADIVIDGKTLVRDVPAPHLLFLEKRCIAILELISAIPTLNPASTWLKNEGSGLFETAPEETLRTKKVTEFPIVAPATDKHPAQVKEITVDVTVGTWREVRLSGAVPAQRKAELMARAEQVQQAVKLARERANQTPVVELSSSALVDFIFAS